MNFEVGMNTKEVQDFFKAFPQKAKLAVADGLDHATRSFYAQFYQERLQGPPGVKATHGGIFHRFRRTVRINDKTVFLRQQAKQGASTGKIMQSAEDPLNMTITMFSQSKVAGKLETGGTIHSKGGLMPVPLNEKAVNFIKANLGWGRLSLMKINGKYFLGRKTRFGRPELLFLLVRNVRVRPRLGFYLTWERHAARRMEILDQSLTKALQRA